MKKSRSVELIILFVTALMLSGCVWGGYDEHRGEDHHERDRGDHQGDHQGDHRGDHRGDRQDDDHRN
jgi:hypothetical protein